MIWRLIPYQLGASAWNMAVDEAIFHHYLKGLVPPTLRFYGWVIPTLSLGYFQDVTNEVDLINLKKKKYGLVRRCTGGRAVLHHHELTYSIVGGSKDGFPTGLIETYFYVSRVFVEAFRYFGVKAALHRSETAKNLGGGACFEAPSWYEVVVDGKKLVGSAQLRWKDAFLQHGAILLDFSASDLVSVLNLPESSSPKYLALLNQKVTSFRHLGKPVQPTELSCIIARFFKELYQKKLEEQDLSQSENEFAESLVHEKYGCDRWNLIRGKAGNNLHLKEILLKVCSSVRERPN